MGGIGGSPARLLICCTVGAGPARESEIAKLKNKMREELGEKDSNSEPIDAIDASCVGT